MFHTAWHVKTLFANKCGNKTVSGYSEDNSMVSIMHCASCRHKFNYTIPKVIQQLNTVNNLCCSFFEHCSLPGQKRCKKFHRQTPFPSFCEGNSSVTQIFQINCFRLFTPHGPYIRSLHVEIQTTYVQAWQCIILNI